MLHLLSVHVSFGIPEMIVFQLGAVVLGFCIHLFLVSRRNSILQTTLPDPNASEVHPEDWKMKYFADMDQQELQRNQLKEELRRAQDREAQTKQELATARVELADLKNSVDDFRPADNSEYVLQLAEAQEKMERCNSQLHDSLGHLQHINESEKKYAALKHTHDQLNDQFVQLQNQLSHREIELKQLKQHRKLGEEMTGRLEKAYTDYNLLQQKLSSLELNLSQSRQGVQGYDELQEAYFKLTKEFDELKLKQIDLMEENQRMGRVLADTEDKLREANFQRQQLTRKVSFMEELNRDLQQVSEQQKKLQGQFRRLNDIEQMLSRASQPGSNE